MLPYSKSPTLVAEQSPEPVTNLRRKPSQERGIQRVQQILDATERLLISLGYEAMSTNHVAATAGVSIGSLYQFFKNKESLLLALVERYRDMLLAALTIAPQQVAEATPAMLINHFLGVFARFGMQHSGVAIFVLISRSSEDAAHGHAIQSIFQETRERIVAIIHQRMPRLTLEQCQLHAMAAQTAGKALMLYLLTEHRAGRQELAESILAESGRMQIAYFEAVLRQYHEDYRVPANPSKLAPDSG